MTGFSILHNLSDFSLNVKYFEKKVAFFDEIKSLILDHYYPNSTPEHHWNSLYMVGIVHVHAILIVYSAELVGKMNADTTIYHPTGQLRVFPYPPVRVCSRCCDFGHQKDNCTSAPVCTRCATPGHEGSMCSSFEKKCHSCFNSNQFKAYSHHFHFHLLKNNFKNFNFDCFLLAGRSPAVKRTSFVINFIVYKTVCLSMSPAGECGEQWKKSLLSSTTKSLLVRGS